MMNILVALFVLQCGLTVLATDKTDSPENNRSPALRYGPDYPYDNRYGDYPDVNRYDRWRGGYYPSDNRYYDRYSNNNGYYYRDPYGDRYDSRWYGRNPYNYPYGDRGSEYYPNYNRFYPDGSRFDNRDYGGRYPSDSRYGYFYPYYNRYGYGRYLRSENNGVNTSPLPPGYVPQNKYAANAANPQSIHFRLKPPGGRDEFIRSFSASENSESFSKTE